MVANMCAPVYTYEVKIMVVIIIQSCGIWKWICFVSNSQRHIEVVLINTMMMKIEMSVSMMEETGAPGGNH